VQLPIFNEMYVVERLLKSVAALDYPRDLLQVQVLDDSTDETTETRPNGSRTLKARWTGYLNLVRRKERVGFKAGALEGGLRSCKGEFVLILDADFVPAHDMAAQNDPLFQPIRALG